MSEVGKDDLVFEGSLGALVAVTFVVFEIFLLPLFEYTRNSLTIAIVRNRICQEKPVKLCPENTVPAALGLSDGVHGYSAFITIPRALKIFFKVTLIISVFVWEIELDTINQAQMLSFQFNSDGPYGPVNESSVMFPFPILGTYDPDACIMCDKEDVILMSTGNSTFFTLNGSAVFVKGIESDYSINCVSTEHDRRFAYAAIFSRSKLGEHIIYCLNGTESRERQVVLSYNRVRANHKRADVSSAVLEAQSRMCNCHSKSAFFFNANVTIPARSPLNGTHQGFLRFRYAADNKSSAGAVAREWEIDGFLIHSGKGTILRLTEANISPFCYNNTMQIGGQKLVNHLSVNCLDFIPEKKNFHVDWHGSRIVEDIDLVLSKSPVLRVGTPDNVIREWVSLGNVFPDGVGFADSIWKILNLDNFYFTTPAKTEFSLRVGAPKKLVRIKKWSTWTIVVVVMLFFTYCITSLFVQYCSRIRTGIRSECFSRTAVMEILRHKAILGGEHHLNDPEKLLTIGFPLGKIPKKGRILLLSPSECEET